MCRSFAAIGLLAATWAGGILADQPPQEAPPQQETPQQEVPQQDVPAVPVPPPIPQAPIPGFQPVPRSDGSGGDRPTLFATDRMAARRLKLAESRLERGIYEEAVDLLQTILDGEEDAAAPADNDAPVFRSLKRQAIDLLSKLPPDGRRIYELKYGIAARGQLDVALKQGDWEGVEAVSRRYFHTAAGREATYRLAVWADDRGESLEAALLFQRLLDDGLSPFEPRLSLRTAAAWWKAGMVDPAKKSADRFIRLSVEKATDLPDAITQAKSPEQLLAWLERSTGAGQSSAGSDWPMLGGSADRLAGVAPVAIAEGVAWSHRLHEPTQWDSARDAARVARLSVGLDLLTKAAKSSGYLTQPAFHPVVAQNAVIFRTLRNIQAVDLASGQLLWQSESPHDQYFDKAANELGLLVSWGQDDFGGAMSLGEAVGQFAWENLTAGTLSTDGRFVYGVEGTGRADTARAIVQGIGRPGVVGEENFNTLVAYELAAEGRIAWTAGGPPTDDPSSGVFFLGPPLALGGRLYALADRDGSIELLAMDPTADIAGRVVWSQTLVESDEPLNARRRLSGLSPSFADGVLVCPTGAGAVVGVDLARRVLLWGYEYAGRTGSGLEPGAGMFFSNPQAISSRQSRWLDAVPHIADGAVFLTPLDSDELHCLNLSTGDVRWRHPRESLLYLAAVHERKAIVVGRRSLIAFDVETGQTVWERPLDEMPSGRGVQSGDLYHLPLMSGDVATIRLSNHQELVRSPAGAAIVPGNLIAVQGRLLSLSTDAVTGFERSADLEAAPRDAADADGNVTADEIARRGIQALHRGKEDEGLALLRRAAAMGESPAARRAYVHVLLEGLRADFAAYQQYVNDVSAFVEDPRQKADFYQLLADGFQAKGDLPAAFEALLGLAASDVAEPDYSIVGGERLVRRDRLDGVRIKQLLASASPAERSRMEETAQQLIRGAAERHDVVALERLAARVGDAGWKRSVLKALEAHYDATGAARELEHVRFRLGESPRNGASDAAVARSDFDVGWRAEYVPGEIKTGRVGPAAEMNVSIPVVGSVPESHSGWQFSLAANGRSLVACDSIGRERWRLSLTGEDSETEPDPFGGRHMSPGRAQVRFSAHLMAVVVGTRLWMLDVTSDAGPPPVLWTANLASRIYTNAFINRRVMNSPADGPIGFAGSDVLLYEGGGALYAVDPLTGDVFWRRAGIPDDCELSGDDEFVTLQLPSGGDVFVLDISDGRIVAQRALPEMFRRLAWVGTSIVTARPNQQTLEITSDDLARGEHRWSHRFSSEALVTPVDSGEIAVLEPAAGRLLLIRNDDGSIVFEARTEADPAVAEIAVTRRFGRILLFTTRREPAGPVRVETDRTRTAVDGLAYGFDGQGSRVWSTIVRQQHVDLQQPPGLPILLLTAKRYALGGQASHHAALLDVRNGHVLIEQRRASEFQPVSFDVAVASPQITIECQGARILLTPTSEPIAPAKADRLTDLADGQRDGPTAQP